MAGPVPPERCTCFGHALGDRSLGAARRAVEVEIALALVAQVGNDAKQVSAYTGPAYDHFGLKLGQQTVNDTFLASGRVLFLSIQPATWTLVIKLEQRASKTWKVIATQRSGGKNLSRGANYRINTYGKSLKLRGAADAFERDRTRGKRYRVVLAAKVSTPGGKVLFSRGLQQAVTRNTCKRGLATGGYGFR